MVWTLDRHKNCGGSWLIVVQPVTTLAVGRAEERCHVPDIEWQYAPGRWNMTKNSTLAVVRVQITVLENKVTSRVQESSAEIQSTEYRWLNGNLPLATSGHWEQVKPGTQQQLPPSHVYLQQADAGFE